MKKTLLVLISILSAAYCLAQTTQVGYRAQREEDLQQHKGATVPEYTFQAGDTIIIAKDCATYLTGENMSEWVYFVRHIVGQTGGKRFPNGLLIRGIYSWVDPHCVHLAGPIVPSAAALARVEEDKPAVEERQQEVQNMPQENRDALREKASEHDAIPFEEPDTTAVVAVVEEPAPVEEEPVVEEPVEVVEETAAVDTVPAKEPTPQYDRFTIGARGGVASLLQDAGKMNWKPGFDVLLDLQYAHYWKPEAKPAMGIIVGASVGYSRSPLKGDINDRYTTATDNGDIDYTITAKNLNEKGGQLQLEVPVLFSLITDKGFFFNVGPRIMIPVWMRYNQKIDDAHIVAYFQEEDVTVPDELVTGKVTDNTTKGSFKSAKVNIMLTCELGYEWQLKSGNSLGLGVYADYSVWSLYSNKADNKSLFSVTNPSNAGNAKVDIFSANDTYNKHLGYFDVGIKLAYHFNFWKK